MVAGGDGSVCKRCMDSGVLCGHRVTVDSDSYFLSLSVSLSPSLVQVWNHQCLVKTVAVTDLKKHGKIHEDSEWVAQPSPTTPDSSSPSLLSSLRILPPLQ